MQPLTRIAITMLIVLITIPLALSGQRRPGPGAQRRPARRPPGLELTGNVEEARSFLERADVRIPFSNEILSATFTASLYDYEATPSATGDIGLVLSAFRTTRDQRTTTYEVRWRQGTPFEEVVAIKGAHFDPETMSGGDYADRQSAYFGSVLSFAWMARLIVPPRFSQWLRDPVPLSRDERAAAASERMARRMRGRDPSSEDRSGWVDTQDSAFNDYYKDSSVLVDHGFMGRQETGGLLDVFNLEVALPEDRAGRDAFRLWGLHSDDPALPPAIFDAFVYEQEESVNRPRLLQSAPYHVKWHYPDARSPVRRPGFEIFYSPVYIAQVPPVNHALEMDSGFGPGDPGPDDFYARRFIRHEWSRVGPYQVPSTLRINEFRMLADGTVEAFDDPTEILVSGWNIVTREGESFQQEPEDDAEPAPSLTGDVDEARRLLAAADSRISAPGGGPGQGSFTATYHPHLDDPASRADDYRFSVVCAFDTRSPFSAAPFVGEYFIKEESEGAVYNRAGYNAMAETMGRGAELRMTEFVALALPPTFASLLPADSAGALSVTVADDGNLIRIDGETGYGGVRNIEIQFDPATTLPVRTGLNRYDVQWTYEPASGDRFRVTRLEFTNAVRQALLGRASGNLAARPSDDPARGVLAGIGAQLMGGGGTVEYEWSGAAGSETLTGMSINGWDVRLSDWKPIE